MRPRLSEIAAHLWAFFLFATVMALIAAPLWLFPDW